MSPEKTGLFVIAHAAIRRGVHMFDSDTFTEEARGHRQHVAAEVC